MTRARRWIATLGVITAAIVLPIGTLGVTGLWNESRLAAEGEPLCAPLTAWRIVDGRRVRHELKYAFVIEGVTYRASDETGRDDLWQSVPEREWHRAVAAGCVDVVHLPSDPEVSRPARSEASNDPVANKIAALGLCAIALGLFAAATWRIAAVARARRWSVTAVDGDGAELAAGADRRRVRFGDVRRARLLVLPRAQVHPPWRFETDVLELRTRDGDVLVITREPGEAFAAVLARLEPR